MSLFGSGLPGSFCNHCLRLSTCTEIVSPSPALITAPSGACALWLQSGFSTGLLVPCPVCNPAQSSMPSTVGVVFWFPWASNAGANSKKQYHRRKNIELSACIISVPLKFGSVGPCVTKHFARQRSQYKGCIVFDLTVHELLLIHRSDALLGIIVNASILCKQEGIPKMAQHGCGLSSGIAKITSDSQLRAAIEVEPHHPATQAHYDRFSSRRA